MTLQISTPNDTTVVLTRSFQAPRQLVWKAMTEPALMRRWMLQPPGWTMKSCECEARVGGVLKVVSKTAEADPAMTLQGVFTEVVKWDRMVHTEQMVTGTGEVLGSLVETHEFSEKNGVTSVRITQVHASKEACAGAREGMEGMEACYAELDAVLTESR